MKAAFRVVWEHLLTVLCFSALSIPISAGGYFVWKMTGIDFFHSLSLSRGIERGLRLYGALAGIVFAPISIIVGWIGLGADWEPRDQSIALTLLWTALVLLIFGHKFAIRGAWAFAGVLVVAGITYSALWHALRRLLSLTRGAGAPSRPRGEVHSQAPRKTPSNTERQAAESWS